MRLVRLLANLVQRPADRLARAQTDLAKLSPVHQIERREQALREQQRRLHSALTLRLQMSQSRLNATRGRERIERALANRFAEQGRKLESQHQRLVALSPESVLTRGYSITRDAASGAILRSAAEAAVQQKVTIQLGSGKLAGRVEEVSP